jgi:hypothetical protein
MIVFATDAIIQIFTVMIEILNTSVAFFAVIALFMNMAFTFLTLDKLRRRVFLINFKYQVIDWIVASEIAVVIGYQQS